MIYGLLPLFFVWNSPSAKCSKNAVKFMIAIFSGADRLIAYMPSFIRGDNYFLCVCYGLFWAV